MERMVGASSTAVRLRCLLKAQPLHFQLQDLRGGGRLPGEDKARVHVWTKAVRSALDALRAQPLRSGPEGGTRGREEGELGEGQEGDGRDKSAL